MKPLYLFSAILLAACAGQDVTTLENIDAPPPEVEALDVSHDDTPENFSIVEQPLAAICSDNRVLYLWPDPNIIPFVQAAIDKYALLGFNVAIETTHGVRMYETTADLGGQARSYWKGAAPCSYDSCTVSNSHINVTTALLQRTDTQFIINSIEHEIGHLISGFGSCVTPAMGLTMADSLHLVAGHLISNGNTGYANMTCTEQDTILLRSCL